MPHPWIQLFIDVPRESWQTSLDFWSAATGWTPSVTRGEDGQFATLLTDDGEGWVKLQAIDGPPRVHLDLDSPDPVAAEAHSLALGAERAWVYEDVPVLRSPGGLLYCHTAGARGRIVRSDPLRVLDQVCIDIPAGSWEREIAFWRDLTGRPLTKGGEPEFAFLGEDGSLRILLQRLDDDEGPVRAHVDVAVADRPTETRRQVDLGATLVEVFEWWTVLRAPDGHVYCLTDRDPGTGNVSPR